MSNFIFLKNKWPILENLGRLAERNLYIDNILNILRIKKNSVAHNAYDKVEK